MVARIWIARRLFLTAFLSMPVLATAGGCEECLAVLNGTPAVIVALKNNGDFPVDVRLFYSDRQDISADDLRRTGVELDYTIPDGETRTFFRDCASLQAIMIDHAELQVFNDNGPSDETGVLRTGADFNCRETLVFKFEYSDAVADFHIEESTQNSALFCFQEAR